MTDLSTLSNDDLMKMLSNDELRTLAGKTAQPTEDKYTTTVRAEREADRARGIPVDANQTLPRRALQGATFGAADEVLAAAVTPFEMIKRGTWDPREGYNYAKAREDLEMSEMRKKQGVAGHAMEIGGGFAGGAGLARAGLTAAPRGVAATATTPAVLPSFGAKVGGAAIDGAGYGAVTGFNEGSGEGRLEGAVKGGVIGAGAGAAVQGAAPLVAGLASKGTALVRANVNPRDFAEKQFTRAVAESSQTPRMMRQGLEDAAADGQGMYVAADALGNPGQRMLSTVTRAPGDGRTQAVEFLNQRQVGQGRRIQNTLAEGFDAPRTAEQTREALTNTRSTTADANYRAARSSAGAVDTTPAIQAADNFLQPGASRVMNPGTQIADDSVEAAVRKARGYLTDGRSQISDFNAAFRAKTELDAMIERAAPTVQRQLIPVRNALDDALARTSQPYAHARDTFRQQSNAIDAVDTGVAAAKRGRYEDTIPRFAQLSPAEQQGFRAGYADPLIADVQGAAGPFTNRGRFATSDAFRAEGPAFAAPGRGDQMTRRLDRENRMFETRTEAMGGSKTKDNMADAEAMTFNPEILSNILTGRWGSATKNLLSRGSDTMSGYTPAVRRELADLLLANGGRAQDVERVVAAQAARGSAKARAMANFLRGGMGATADAPSSLDRRR